MCLWESSEGSECTVARPKRRASIFNRGPEGSRRSVDDDRGA
jgi:hypothetical protein